MTTTYYFLILAKSLSSVDNAVDTTDKTTAPKIAGSQPSIISPGTTYETINKTTALTTKVNNPSVTTVKGAVTKCNTGLIKVFTTPRTIEAKTAEVKLSTLNPGTIYAVASSATAFKSKARMICKLIHPLSFFDIHP